jgi:phosphoribosyl 1,2-cyclic phosphate phosphodiesterase
MGGGACRTRPDGPQETRMRVTWLWQKVYRYVRRGSRRLGLETKANPAESQANWPRNRTSNLDRRPVPRPLITTDIRGQFILLGTGTSVGVPSIGCGCEVCLSKNPRNRRTRASAILGLPGGNLLIDTSPDLRQQLLREKIGIVHAVLYTHEHADHIFGLDDLRLMQFQLGGPVPLYCEARVEERIRKSYDYAFMSTEGLHPGAVPQLALNRISTEPFDILGVRVVPIRLKHGPRFDVLGFRFGNLAYCTDVNAIAPES